MKKVLALSTALATAAMLSSPALAADPLSLQLGGFSNWYFGYVSQDRTPTGGRFQEFDVKGDNEIFFSASTKLDNGLTVGLNIEFEAGGTTDITDDPVDEAYVFVQGGFGKLIIGSEDNGAALMHVSAPDVSIALQDGDYWMWVQNPGIADFMTTYISRDSDANKLIYVTPQFAGLSASVTYVPNVQECYTGGRPGIAGSLCGDRQTPMTEVTGDQTDAVAFGLGYTAEYGALAVAASFGYYHGWVQGFDGVDEFSLGLKLTWNEWSFGGSYRAADEDPRWGFGLDGQAWDVGVSYTTGPYAVSLGYYRSDAEGVVIGNGRDDETSLVQASFNYTMGPGVNAIATIFHVDYDGEAGVQNEGWGGITGLRLAF